MTPQDPAADTGAPGSAAAERGAREVWRDAYKASREDGASESHAMARGDLARIEFDKHAAAIEAEARAAADAEVRRLTADLSAIYGRMRHTHSDDVSCADAGPTGHPPPVGSLAASQPSAAAGPDFDPALYEPAVDDFGNQYLARLAASQPPAAAAQGPGIDVDALVEAMIEDVGGVESTTEWTRQNMRDQATRWLARLAARPDPAPAGAPE